MIGFGVGVLVGMALYHVCTHADVRAWIADKCSALGAWIATKVKR